MGKKNGLRIPTGGKVLKSGKRIEEEEGSPCKSNDIATGTYFNKTGWKHVMEKQQNEKSRETE